VTVATGIKKEGSVRPFQLLQKALRNLLGTKKYILVSVKEMHTGRMHSLLYIKGHDPEDICVRKLISDVYDVPKRYLKVEARYECSRDRGFLRRPLKPNKFYFNHRFVQDDPMSPADSPEVRQARVDQASW
jgi:hypothetical protein